MNAHSTVTIDRHQAEVRHQSGLLEIQPVSLDWPAHAGDPSGSDLWALLISLATNEAGDGTASLAPDAEAPA